MSAALWKKKKQSIDMQMHATPELFDVPRLALEDVKKIEMKWIIYKFDSKGKRIIGKLTFDLSDAEGAWALWAYDAEE